MWADMMIWFIWLIIALVLTTFGRYLHTVDEIYGLALFSTAFLSALWGLVMAPTAVPLSLALLVMGWLQFRSSFIQGR
ncbi:hypothetical protein XM38_008230 [Halomicronema hongdechloris C2206]|uniref:Uncharacterized protein n=1 Tax=Halomicronema hongdechloris C2206 TaxID=1641165 RepID=A0A1V8NFQ4_9CYAN|nr:hypothetical protein XM38_008230 [Halomicronema hongdechloris C2206]